MVELKYMENNKHIGMCGLECSSCAAFIATKNNDDLLKEKTAKEWTKRYLNDNGDKSVLKPEDINCTGCLSDDPKYLYCNECNIRQCCLKKGISNCKECSSYKCDDLVMLQSHFF